MTATDTQPIDVPEDEWRGRITDDHSDDLPIDESVPRRREARALLGELLRPHQLTVALLRSSSCWRTSPACRSPTRQRGIDRGIPPILPAARRTR